MEEKILTAQEAYEMLKEAGVTRAKDKQIVSRWALNGSIQGIAPESKTAGWRFRESAIKSFIARKKKLPEFESKYTAGREHALEAIKKIRAEADKHLLKLGSSFSSAAEQKEAHIAYEAYKTSIRHISAAFSLGHGVTDEMDIQKKQAQSDLKLKDDRYPCGLRMIDGRLHRTFSFYSGPQQFLANYEWKRLGWDQGSITKYYEMDGRETKGSTIDKPTLTKYWKFVDSQEKVREALKCTYDFLRTLAFEEVPEISNAEWAPMRFNDGFEIRFLLHGADCIFSIKYDFDFEKFDDFTLRWQGNYIPAEAVLRKISLVQVVEAIEQQSPLSHVLADLKNREKFKQLAEGKRETG